MQSRKERLCSAHAHTCTHTLGERMRRHAGEESCSSPSAGALEVVVSERTCTAGTTKSRFFPATFLQHNSATPAAFVHGCVGVCCLGSYSGRAESMLAKAAERSWRPQQCTNSCCSSCPAPSTGEKSTVTGAALAGTKRWDLERGTCMYVYAVGLARA